MINLNKFIITISLVLASCLSFVYGQNKTIDSLKIIYNTTNKDSIKSQTLIKIAKEFHESQLDSSLFYYIKSYNLIQNILAKLSSTSKNIKSIKLMLCNCLIGMGNLYLENGDIKNCLKIYNQCLSVCNEFNLKNIAADVYEYIGYAYKQNGNKEEEYKNLIKSLNIREEINNKLGIANSLHSLGHFYREKGDILKAIEYHEKSKIIFEKLDDVAGVTMSLNCIGNFYFNKGDNSLALEYYTKCFDYCQKKNFKKGISRLYQSIGNVYLEIGNIIKAFENYTKYLKNAEEMKDQREIALALVNLSDFYSRQGNITKAINYCIQVLKIYEKIGDKTEIIDLNNDIGSLYLEQDSISKASIHFLRALRISEKINYKIGIVNYYAITGDIYRKQNNYIKALQSYESGLKIADKLINKDQAAELYTSIGEMNQKLSNTKTALDFFDKSLKIYLDLDNKIGIVNSLKNISSLYFIQKKYIETTKLLNESMSIAKEIESPEIISEIAKELHIVQSLTGNYKESLMNFKLFIKMRDSINNIEDQKTMIRQESQFEFNKKQAFEREKHNSELRIQKEKSESEKKKRNIIIFSVSLILILLLIFSILLFNRFKITQKQKHIIATQKSEVEKQKHLLEDKQKEILDSIHYAKRLQEAILPPLHYINEHLPNNFVLYQPKDVVAGDFYWAEIKDDKFFIAAADCTGHGVPGAMVSVVCSNALNRTVNEFGITNTGNILDKTRELVLETFAKGNAEVKDGMDISLLCIDKKNNKAFWSGANNPLWYLKSSVTSSAVEKSTDAGLDSARPDIQLIEIKADKQPIGKTEITKPFTAHEIALQDGMQFYLFTDGFADQFGGPKGKKFMYKQLENLLISISHESMEIQKQKLEDVFKNWKGDLEQVDDVCVIGVKI